MKPQTIGYKYSIGRAVPIQCRSNDDLETVSIKDDCFLMLILSEGSGLFRIGERTFEAVAPCFVCFDESSEPVLLRNNALRCDSVYFHPMFLNVNMTFEQVHSNNYWNTALNHDMFLLKPFTDKSNFVYPIFDENTDRVLKLFNAMKNELAEQRDWYWSCRGRSYFMELILMLERLYGIVDKEDDDGVGHKIRDKFLRNAVMFIESNYQDDITLEMIVEASGINHSSLNKRFKAELGVTPMEYLWRHRILVAKKHLEFTELTVSEISARCGFKTVQHFSRKFEHYCCTTPTDFRNKAVEKRKAAFL